jgi:hypothetical protein
MHIEAVRHWQDADRVMAGVVVKFDARLVGMTRGGVALERVVAVETRG